MNRTEQFKRGLDLITINPGTVVAVHKLDPKGVNPGGTRIICAVPVGRECATSYALSTEPVGLVVERLNRHGLKLEGFEGPKGFSYIATSKIFEVGPRYGGELPGSFVKLAVGGGVYWPCSLVNPPEELASYLASGGDRP